MQGSSTKSDRTALPEVASSALGEPDADRGWRNPSSVALSIRANQARNQNGGSQYVDPPTSERQYATAELEFMQAMTEYKKQSGRMFPTWSEVLEVLRGLGYEKPTRGSVVAQGERSAGPGTKTLVKSGASGRRAAGIP